MQFVLFARDIMQREFIQYSVHCCAKRLYTYSSHCSLFAACFYHIERETAIEGHRVVAVATFT